MNCKYAHRHLVDLFDAQIDKKVYQKLLDHINSCENCGREYNEMKQVFASIKPSILVESSSNFKQNVMNKIIKEENAMVRKEDNNEFYIIDSIKNMFNFKSNKLIIVSATVLMLLIALPIFNWLGFNTGGSSKYAFSVLAKAIEATSKLHSVHIKARMRTIAHDNFEYIGLDLDFVPHDMWKEFSDLPKWRIEKPGRVVVMDGKEQLLYIKTTKHAYKGGPNANFVEWLRPLLNPQQVLDREQRLAKKQNSKLKIEEKEQNGLPKLILTVEAKAKGDYSNDWCKNKSIVESDNRRVYQFDAQTKLLDALQVYVISDGKDILVFETTQIEYNIEIDPALFSLVLPEDTVWGKPLESMPVDEKLKHLTAEEAARALFQACADENWDNVLQFYPLSDLSPKMKKIFGGMEIISLGRPFKSGQYAGWFVPYEIKLKSGKIKKHNLAIRNDNPAKRWLVDGGF